MIEYREFLDLTDDEIEFIINDIFHPVKVDNMQRDKECNEITVDVTTIWKNSVGKENEIEITDIVTLTPNLIIADFSLAKGDEYKYKQFLLVKGCNELLKDNPYLEE